MLQQKREHEQVSPPSDRRRKSSYRGLILTREVSPRISNWNQRKVKSRLEICVVQHGAAVNNKGRYLSAIYFHLAFLADRIVSLHSVMGYWHHNVVVRLSLCPFVTPGIVALRGDVEC